MAHSNDVMIRPPCRWRAPRRSAAAGAPGPGRRRRTGSPRTARRCPGRVDHPRVEQHDRLRARLGRADHRGGPADAELRGGEPDALAEMVQRRRAGPAPRTAGRPRPRATRSLGGQVEAGGPAGRSRSSPRWTMPAARIRSLARTPAARRGCSGRPAAPRSGRVPGSATPAGSGRCSGGSLGGPVEDRPAAGGQLLGDRGAQRPLLGGQRGLHAPDRGSQPRREVEPRRSAAGWAAGRPAGTSGPTSPRRRGTRTRWWPAAPGRAGSGPRRSRRAATTSLNASRSWLGPPVHRLARAVVAVRRGCSSSQVSGCSRWCRLERAGVVRVAVHGDPDQVAGDRLGAGVVELAADDAAVVAVDVGQAWRSPARRSGRCRAAATGRAPAGRGWRPTPAAGGARSSSYSWKRCQIAPPACRTASARRAKSSVGRCRRASTWLT